MQWICDNCLCSQNKKYTAVHSKFYRRFFYKQIQKFWPHIIRIHRFVQNQAKNGVIFAAFFFKQCIYLSIYLYLSISIYLYLSIYLSIYMYQIDSRLLILWYHWHFSIEYTLSRYVGYLNKDTNLII